MFKTIEWLAYRLFCGAECWMVHCVIYFDSNRKVANVFRTYKSLSKHVGNLDSIAPELAQEIMVDFQLKMGVPAAGCQIVSVERVW